jgi:hypothetical protein
MKRNTYILIGILAVLILAAILVLQRPGEQSVSADAGEALVAYDSTAIDRIEISSAAAATTLQLEGNGWMMTAPLHVKADDAGIHQLLGKGKAISLKALVSSNPQKQSVFQVDTSGTLVRMFEKGTQRAAFRIGKNGPGYTETYVRREGSNDVFLADGMLVTYFVKQPRDWRDKAILRLPMEGMKNIRYQYGDTTFTLAFQDSAWKVDGLPPAEQPVRNVLGSLAMFSADDFVDTTITAPPPLTAVIDIEGSQLRFHRDPLTNNYFVISSVGPQVYVVQGWHAAQVLKRKNEFLPTTP